MEIQKRCTACSLELPLSEFRKQSKNKDGLKYICKICDDARAKKRYEHKKESIINQVKHWQANNKDKVTLYKSKYLQKKKSEPIISNEILPSSLPQNS